MYPVLIFKENQKKMNDNGQDKSLVIVEDGILPGTAVNYPQVTALADRLMSLHPAAREVGVDAMRSVAMLALTTGANPLPGTNGIHAWKDNKGKIAIQLGIGFLRGEVEKVGGLLWAERPRPMSPEERKKYNIPDGIAAAYCRAALGKAVFDLMRKAREFGITLSLKEAKEEVAAEGIGTAGQNDYAKAGRPHIWTATERAERDLIRHLVPILKEARERMITGEFVKGGPDWTPGEFVRSHDAEPLPAGYDYRQANADLFGDEEPDAKKGVTYIIDEISGRMLGEKIDEDTAFFYDDQPEQHNWHEAADTAETLDGWAFAVYQLTDTIYRDAGQVRAGYLKIIGEYDPMHNQEAREVFEWYTQAIADSKDKRGPLEIARHKYAVATGALVEESGEEGVAMTEPAEPLPAAESEEIPFEV
jgi:hypothetical protein